MRPRAGECLRLILILPGYRMRSSKYMLIHTFDMHFYIYTICMTIITIR